MTILLFYILGYCLVLAACIAHCTQEPDEMIKIRKDIIYFFVIFPIFSWISLMLIAYFYIDDFRKQRREREIDEFFKNPN